MRKLEEYKTYSITYNDKKYPNKLKCIDHFPLCLFYKGNINLLNKKSLAILGNTVYSKYGKKVATNIAYKVARHGIIIISDDQKGLNAYAHLGAIAAGMPSICVLSNNIDNYESIENKRLKEKILNNGGLIITEYLIGTKYNEYINQAKNRIITGISDGLLLLELTDKESINYTIDATLEQGKEIYAIPENITIKNSFMTNILLKQGAKVVTCVNDILEDYF